MYFFLACWFLSCQLRDSSLTRSTQSQLNTTEPRKSARELKKNRMLPKLYLLNKQVINEQSITSCLYLLPHSFGKWRNTSQLPLQPLMVTGYKGTECARLATGLMRDVGHKVGRLSISKGIEITVIVLLKMGLTTCLCIYIS